MDYHYLAVQGVYFPGVSVEAVFSVKLHTTGFVVCNMWCNTKYSVVVVAAFYCYNLFVPDYVSKILNYIFRYSFIIQILYI